MAGDRRLAMVDTLILGLSRIPRALRPTPLTLLLLLFLIAPAILWLSEISTHLEIHDKGVTSSTEFLLGLIVVSTVHSPGTPAIRTVEVGWVALVYVLLAGFVVARATAAAIERATAGLLSPVRWTLFGVAVAVALGFLAATTWSRLYWGYWFRRPPVSASIEALAQATAASPITCEAAEGRYRCSVISDRTLAEEVSFCRRYRYECLRGRIAVALYESGSLLADAPPFPSGSMRRIEQLLATPGLLAPVEQGYGGNDHLRGVAASGRTASGQPVIVVGLAGSQVSNDHYPYYEVLLSLGGERATIERKRIIFYDVAGMEGFEWVAMFVYATPAALTFALPICLVATTLCGLRRRRHRRQDLALPTDRPRGDDRFSRPAP